MKFYLFLWVQSQIMDELYPSEEKIRTEFIKKVEAAERRVREGKFTQYTPEEFENFVLHSSSYCEHDFHLFVPRPVFTKDLNLQRSI